jgi:small GTP-binding protein
MTSRIQKKICLVGAYAVGKTSLVKRFVDSLFDERYHTTIGVKVDKKSLFIEDTALTLMIWDLAGEDDVEQVRISHLRGASGYILVADGCRNSTLERAIALRKCINDVVGRIASVVALNKADIRDEWEAEPALMNELGADGSAVFHTSAKTGEFVEDMFRALAIKMLGAS